jgi:ankyrin repeat protein
MSRSQTSRALTSRTSLDHLRKDAKRWLKTLRAGDPVARARLKAAWPQAPAEPALRDLQHALAREYGQDSWIALKTALADLALARRSLQERAEVVLRNGWGGDLAAARRLLARDPRLARSSFYAAAACGDLEAVEDGLARDPDAARRTGGPLNWTALAYVAYGRLDAVNGVTVARRLLEAGADPNFQFDDGWGSPFKLVTGAIGMGEGNRPGHPQAVELVDLLIGAGASAYDSQALYDISIVGADIDWYDRLWRYGEAAGVLDHWFIPGEGRLGFAKGMSTLDYLLGNAVGQDHLQRAAWLLERDADPNANHFYMGQKLHLLALLSGYGEMADLLRRHGARPSLLNDAQAFQAACLRGDQAMIKLLLDRDPSLIERPEALHAAVGRGDLRAFDLLVSLGARTDILESDGISPLHRAVQSGSVALVKRLLELGADVDLRERRWHGTPMSWSIVLGKPAVADYLAPLSHDVRPFVADGRLERLETALTEQPWRANERLPGDCPTALYCLPDDEETAVEAARILLAHGADPKARNDKGQTPADWARLKGLDDAAELMEQGHAR